MPVVPSHGLTVDAAERVAVTTRELIFLLHCAHQPYHTLSRAGKSLVALQLLAKPVFPLRKDKAANMLRVDLKTAGIPYCDEAGRVVDFHALRHTHISMLAQAGVSPKVIQALARHSTITLTMDRYAHAEILNQRNALSVLPDFGSHCQPKAMLATGTYDLSPAGENSTPNSTPNRGRGWPEMAAIDSRDLHEVTENRGKTAFLGTPGRTRTCDLRFRKPPLYPPELRAHAH